MADWKTMLNYAVVVPVTLMLGVAIGANNSLPLNQHVMMLIAVMLVGGLLGGAVNYQLSRTNDPQNTTVKRSVVIGIGASFLVPLFLNMLSSDLNKRTKDEPYALLVFFGFCLIAAISSRAFITTISDRLLKDVQRTAREASEKADAVVESQKEPNQSVAGAAQGQDEGAGVSARSLPVRTPLTDREAQALRALVKPPFTFRFLFGVAIDSGLELDDVAKTLSDLKSRGLVAETKDKENRELYYITGEGRRALEAAPAQ